jgi:hypothetical protein
VTIVPANAHADSNSPLFVQSFMLTFWLTIGFCLLGFVVLMPFGGFGLESQNTAATLMFDTFAVFIQTKMLSALYCNYDDDPPLLVATEATPDPLVCWDGLHMLYGAIALVAIPVFNISSVFVKFRIQSKQSVVVYDLWFVAFQQQLLLLAATVQTFFGNDLPYVLLATLMLCSSTMLMLALFYGDEHVSGHRICNVASLTHGNRLCWTMAWWTSVMAFVSQVLGSSQLHSSGFALFMVFYVGLLVIVMISCGGWFWCKSSTTGARPNAAAVLNEGESLSFFGVERRLEDLLKSEEEAASTSNAPAHESSSLKAPLLLGQGADKAGGGGEGEAEGGVEGNTERTQRHIKMRIPAKTGERCIEASTMHLIVEHIQKHSKRGNATYELTLANVGLEANSLKPLVPFLVGYLQCRGGWCTSWKSSEMALLCNNSSECCASPHSVICFCCLSKPQSREKGLCNCMRCIYQDNSIKCPITSLSLASNGLGQKPKALLLIRDVLKDSRSLTHFDISNNGLGAKQARLIADGLCA